MEHKIEAGSHFDQKFLGYCVDKKEKIYKTKNVYTTEEPSVEPENKK